MPTHGFSELNLLKVTLWQGSRKQPSDVRRFPILLSAICLRKYFEKVFLLGFKKKSSLLDIFVFFSWGLTVTKVFFPKAWRRVLPLGSWELSS